MAAVRQRKRLAFQLGERRFEFLNLNELVLVHIAEYLARVAGGPPDFDAFDARCFPQSYVLLKRRGSKRSAAAYHAVDGPALTGIFYRHFDAGPEGRPIAF